jgi:hypothetical protein
MLFKSAAFLAFATCWLQAQTAPAAAPPCNSTAAYSPCELVFDLNDADFATNPHPYTSVELKAEFRGPRLHTYAIPAYWDGGRRMVIRFAPTEGGQWEYLLTSNLATWNGKTGSFTAADSSAPGFLRAAALHHWAYSEHNRPHLWMGASDLRFAFLDDAAFRALADARAAQKFTHVRGWVMDDGPDSAYQSPDEPNVTQFQRLDQRVRSLNEKGIVADLILAGGAGTLTKVFPSPQQRRRFVRYVVARYAGMNVTWQAVDHFEDYPDARALMKEIGSALKEADGYQHPRTAGARVTSAPLLDDGWMDFAAYGTADDTVGAVEHQLYPVPFVNFDPGSGTDAATFRHRLWNATMDGQYVTGGNTPADAKAMTAWFDVMSKTRHWELEPYFDVDGGRALALEDTEYLVYIEKPGPLELKVEKHGYDVLWIDPSDGETIRRKFNGDHFTGEPPDRTHDWVLHVVRESHLEDMNRSYYFESRDDAIQLQEVEVNPEKLPFEIEQPAGELSLSKPAPYAVKLKRATRATRSMMYLWTGEVTADGQGYRVLATGPQGTLQLPSRLATNYPANMLLRLYGMNANGKVYLVAKGYDLTR